mmetsp:Transcript_74778/g.219114  ORF Transcript_74778/g.219114 Transcript_74778/m.219114 type:complete len:439 (-) Transcript_74778:154-1470(-)
MAVNSNLEHLVREKYSPELLAAIQKVWREKALPESATADQRAERKHFLSQKESPPGAAPAKPCEEASEDDLLELVYKLVLHAPQDWYEIVSEQQLPDRVENDSANVGAALSASSRVRRSGIDFYHWRMTEKLQAGDGGAVFYVGGGRNELLQRQNLPRQGASASCRVVAISDTHLFHDPLTPPPGDVLIHAGDLSYEESRSTQAQKFDAYKASGGPLSGGEFLRWFRASGLQLQGALSWLGSRRGFSHRLLVGGNHDYVLEQLGPRNAEAVCEEYGVTYLHTERPPVRLRFRSGASATFWGSGLSWTSRSANTSFQIPLDQGDAFLDKVGLGKDSVDVMVVHSPPQGHLLAKASEGPDPLGRLIGAVMPKLYVCGHAHRLADPLKGLWAHLGGTLCINAACLGVWNQLHGHPVVVDMSLPSPKLKVPARVPCARCVIQ